jgi:hypothetical protein
MCGGAAEGLLLLLLLLLLLRVLGVDRTAANLYC